jgi:Tol biopolymer transport system component/C-terminal processing protease CtpA/Prc
MKRKSLIAALLLVFSGGSLMAQNNSTPLWMRYPTISPDGKFIAFSYKGNLFRVSSDGGTAELLTSNSAYDFSPVWSPDGKTIAFATNRYGNFDVFTIPATGGEAKRLTYHSADEVPSAFTPDGKSILFSAFIQDNANNILFPSGALSELYSVPTQGGRVTQILTTPAEQAAYSPDGSQIAYTDVKGYEDKWRKHHKSSVTRDIWIYDVSTRQHRKVTTFEGEDRNPVFAPDGKSLFYLSELQGNSNVTMVSLSNQGQPEAISSFTNHPVRFLSVAQNGMLCYQYNGELYTQKPGSKPQKVNIQISTDQTETQVIYENLSNGITEMAVSPDGKEVAFIIRGDIFVTATDYPTTKRITNTPDQERSVSFSSDGRKLLYASERGGSWKVYESSIASTEEPNFTLSTLIKEQVIVDIPEEAFQPLYSPDGKEVAFLKERTTLCVVNLETKKIRTVLDGKYSYSYSDGDQWFQWAPDGNWLAVNFMETPSWPDSDIALVRADGSGEFHNITQSGYDDRNPKWAMDGKAIIWLNDKMGMRSHGSWGSQFDVYSVFLTREAYDEFKLSKQEYELLKEKRSKDKKDSDAGESKESPSDKKKEVKAKKNKEAQREPLIIDYENLDDRKVRLTINSSDLSDAILTDDGEKLYYLSKFEKGYDLWVNNLKDNETKLLVKIDGFAGDLQIDKDKKFLFVNSNGTPMKIEIATNKLSPIKFNAELETNYPRERDYMFEHMWRQVEKKFYDPNLHGVDWKFYKSEYVRFLPHINNNFDFAEMMSELLGELNASHTGCRYRPKPENADQTAALGVFFDYDFEGKGMKIIEVLDNSPLMKANSKVKPGCIIEKVDGIAIDCNSDYYKMLNHKADKLTLLSFYNPQNGERWEESVKPISRSIESELIYKRWVRKNNATVEKLSGGRIGYVHVRGMDSQSFREVYSDILGKHRNKEAIIVDTRFNGGGWLHDDLATLLSGKRYVDFVPRGQLIGSEPISKWYKPSVVIISEGNYSDAHGFPYVYKTLGIGKLVGMPIAGTMTAVWWESQIDPTLVFGIPQMGVKDLNGKYLENQQLNPDIKVAISPEEAQSGVDSQLIRAVEELLLELNKK